MPIQHHAEDILANSDFQNTLVARTTSSDGCITFLGLLEVCYSFSGDSITISIKLNTPFGDVSLGSCTLSPDHQECKLGVSKFGFTAEVTLSLDTSNLSVRICGKLCAPFAGCKSGCTTISF